jgi:hypothetical protein
MSGQRDLAEDATPIASFTGLADVDDVALTITRKDGDSFLTDRGFAPGQVLETTGVFPLNDVFLQVSDVTDLVIIAEPHSHSHPHSRPLHHRTLNLRTKAMMFVISCRICPPLFVPPAEISD